MKLTGKAREALSEWLKGSDDFYNTTVEQLEEYPECMRFGVLVDFFDSVGIEIFIVKNTICYWVRIGGLNYNLYKITRPEARTAAINRANDLFNERFLSEPTH